jgi:hypothetical protein
MHFAHQIHMVYSLSSAINGNARCTAQSNHQDHKHPTLQIDAHAIHEDMCTPMPTSALHFKTTKAHFLNHQGTPQFVAAMFSNTLHNTVAALKATCSSEQGQTPTAIK